MYRYRAKTYAYDGGYSPAGKLGVAGSRVDGYHIIHGDDREYVYRKLDCPSCGEVVWALTQARRCNACAEKLARAKHAMDMQEFRFWKRQATAADARSSAPSAARRSRPHAARAASALRSAGCGRTAQHGRRLVTFQSSGQVWAACLVAGLLAYRDTRLFALKAESDQFLEGWTALSA